MLTILEQIIGLNSVQLVVLSWTSVGLCTPGFRAKLSVINPQILKSIYLSFLSKESCDT